MLHKTDERDRMSAQPIKDIIAYELIKWEFK